MDIVCNPSSKETDPRCKQNPGSSAVPLGFCRSGSARSGMVRASSLAAVKIAKPTAPILAGATPSDFVSSILHSAPTIHLEINSASREHLLITSRIRKDGQEAGVQVRLPTITTNLHGARDRRLIYLQRT